MLCSFYYVSAQTLATTSPARQDSATAAPPKVAMTAPLLNVPLCAGKVSYGLVDDIVAFAFAPCVDKRDADSRDTLWAVHASGDVVAILVDVAKRA